MDAALEADKTSEFAPLLEIAVPEIYERNPFRMLDISVRATSKEVQRLQARRRMQGKLGLSAPAQERPAVEPVANEDDLRRAVDRLNAPVDRLLDELFWFWPLGEEAEDTALRELKAGNSSAAAALWQQRVSSSVEGQVALHNLALLEHRGALEAEARPNAEELQALDFKQRNHWLMRIFASSRVARREREGFEKSWHDIFAKWKRLIDEDGFWDALRNRVRQMDDAQLTTGMVRRLRNTLPLALLSINTQLALRLAERGSADRARRQIVMLQATPFGAQLAESAVRQALQPTLNRIKAATDVAKGRYQRTPHLGDEIVRNLRDQATGLLSAADAILAPGNPTRVGLHDMLAEAILNGQIAFANKTEDWSTCIALAALGLEIAEGPALKARLTENSKVYEANLQTGNNWYTRAYWQLPAETIAVLEDAQKALTAGDVDGVLKTLVVLDPKHGKALKRAFACALNRLAIRDYNNALRSVPLTPTMDAILARLRIMNYRFATPVPNASSWTPRPPCLACGRTSYTSWMNFTWRESRLFMCSDCWSKNSWQERDVERTSLKEPVLNGLQCLQLANEVDPNDVGVLNNLTVLKGKAMGLGFSIPDSAKLRKSLQMNAMRAVRRTLQASLDDETCHYCRRAPAVQASQISVPMCDGRIASVDMLLHKGAEYTTSTVTVPRCRDCEEHHRNLPKRIAQWGAQREAAADKKHFPLIVADHAISAAALATAERAEGEARSRLDLARSSLVAAEQIGTYCRRCRHKYTHWKRSLCTHCDRQVFALEFNAWLAVGAAAVATGGLGYLAERTLRLAGGVWAPVLKANVAMTTYAEAVAIAAGVVVSCLALGLGYLVAKIRQLRDRSQLRTSREAEYARERDIAVRLAQSALHEADAVRVETQADVARRRSADARVREALESARQEAMRMFEAQTPLPTLPAGVRAEIDFVSFPKIAKLVREGWGFGLKPEADLKVRRYPAGEVSGLVGTPVSELARSA